MTILVLAPHADDEVLGPGGTVAKLSSRGEEVVVAILTGHGKEPHPLWPEEAWDLIRAECRQAASVLGVSEIMFRELPAACMDVTPNWQINDVVQQIVSELLPRQLFVPFAFDLHVDHQAIAYSSAVAARPYLPTSRNLQRVVAYEVLSETHLQAPYMTPAFQPNLFVDISEHLEAKLEAMAKYSSQLQAEHMPRSLCSIKNLAALRGAQIGVPAAEAFVILGEYER